jgi:hypothetical protein
MYRVIAQPIKQLFDSCIFEKEQNQETLKLKTKPNEKKKVIAKGL